MKGLSIQNTYQLSQKSISNIMIVILTKFFYDSLNSIYKDGRRLFVEAWNVLKNKYIFNGSKVGYNNFDQLVESNFESTRTIKVFEIPIKWNIRVGTVVISTFQPML